MLGPRTVARTILVAAGVLLAVIAAVYALYLVRRVVGAVAIAVFVAVALAPAVAFAQRRGLPRAAAILAVYVALLGGAFGLGALLAPPLVSEVDTFVREVPGYVAEIRDSNTLRTYDERYGLTTRITEQADKAPRLLDDAAGELETVTVGLFQRVFELILVLAMAFFLLLDGPRWLEFFLRRLPPERRRRARDVIQRSQGAVGGYVAGTFAISAVYGVLTFAVSELLGLPFAVPLAVFMALCSLVPLVGSAIGAAPVALVAALHSFPTSLMLWLVLYVAFDQVLSRVVAPYVYRRTMRLHPLLALVAVLSGASLLGILGALVAIPVAATIQIVVADWWESRPATPPADPGEAPAVA